jgi:hypothetical protein
MIDAVSDMIRRGLAPVPIPAREKGPRLRNWQDLRITEIEISDHFSNGSNVGLILGEPSGGLVDVDLDTREAVAAAKYLLPKTGMIHGRPGNPESHWWYRSDPLPLHKQFKDPDGSVLVELRSNGQTLVPPSVHPQGESLGWKIFDAPAPVSAVCLQKAVKRVAAVAMLARRWASAGGRHNAALALSGGLARLGWPEEEIASFIKAVADAANDEELLDRLRAAEDTQRAISNGDPATGWPTLSQLVGNQVVETARQWLAASEVIPVPLGGDPTIWTPPQPAQVNRELARRPVPMLVKDHANAGGLGFLLGRRGAYKTGLALYTAVSVILGRALFGDDEFAIERPGPVLYLDGHENNQLLYSRLARILNGMGATAEERERVWTNLYTKHTTGINFHRGKWIEELTQWAAEVQPVLMIFDTLMRFYAGGGYTDEDTSKAIVRDAELRHATGAATLWLHHPPKQGGPDPFRGGSGFLDAADFAYEVKKKGHVLEVSEVKYRPGLEPEPFSLRVREETPDNPLEESGVLSFDLLSGSGTLLTSRSNWDKIRSFVHKNPGASKNQILKAVEGQRQRISKEIDGRAEVGDLKLMKEGQKHSYSLPDAENS